MSAVVYHYLLTTFHTIFHMDEPQNGSVDKDRVSPNSLLLSAMLHFINENLPYGGGFQSMKI